MKAAALALAATLLILAFWVAVAFGGERVTMALAGSAAADWLGGTDLVALLVLLVGVSLQAAGIRLWFAHVGQPRGVLPWRVALPGAALSRIWWVFCLMLLFGLFAGDPGPDRLPPPAEQVYRQEAVVAAVLVALHAAALWWWRHRLARGLGRNDD